jgi:hypothetical protein
MQALLELDCMPAGMELFPAASEEQWKWITRVIDESDYYIVVVGGRYGSVNRESGISYTEMEYRYAQSVGKPIIAFLHQSPEKILAGKTEKSSAGKRQLEAFRKQCQQQLCKYWSSPSDLGAKVSRSLTQLIKHNPAAGWVKADAVAYASSDELVRLRAENDRLSRELVRLTGESSTISDEFLGKILKVEFHCECEKRKEKTNGHKYWVSDGIEWITVEANWYGIINLIKHDLLIGAKERSIYDTLNTKGFHAAEESSRETLSENRRIVRASLSSDSLKTIRSILVGRGYIRVDEDPVFGSRWIPSEQTKLFLLESIDQSLQKDLGQQVDFDENSEVIKEEE